MTDGDLQVKNSDFKFAKLKTLEAIVIALIGAAVSLGSVYFVNVFTKPEINPSVKEGLNEVSIKQGLNEVTIEGRWRYFCVANKGHYMHGGRFYIQKDARGYYELIGERTWRDTLMESGIWRRENYQTTNRLNWKSNWIMVRDNTQFNFEYEIVDRTKVPPETIKGYCTGTIIDNLGGKIKQVKGSWNQLYPHRELSGEITFRMVSDAEYDNIPSREAGILP